MDVNMVVVFASLHEIFVSELIALLIVIQMNGHLAPQLHPLSAFCVVILSVHLILPSPQV